MRSLRLVWGEICIMSALFTPLRLRELNLVNRIVVSPMCQYSARDGKANDWHFAHLASMSLSGAAMVIVEATAVETRLSRAMG